VKAIEMGITAYCWRWIGRLHELAVEAKRLF